MTEENQTAVMDDDLVFTDAFREQLPELVGDNYYGKPETKEEPTKAFDDIPDFRALLKSHVDTKRMVGKKLEGMVKIPGDDASDEEKAAFAKAVGVPPSPKDYKFDRPKELPEGMLYNEEMEKHFKQVFHKIGLPAAQANALVEAFNTMQIEGFKQQKEAQATQLKAAVEELRNDSAWKGGNLRKNNLLVLQALDRFADDDLKKLIAEKKISDDENIDNDELWAAIDVNPRQRRLWFNIANAMKLDTLPAGAGGGGPETAKSKAAQRYDHPTSQPLMKGK